jgi:hypothetical protein
MVRAVSTSLSPNLPSQFRGRPDIIRGTYRLTAWPQKDAKFVLSEPAPTAGSERSGPRVNVCDTQEPC